MSGLKQELIVRLNNHLYPNLKGGEGGDNRQHDDTASRISKAASKTSTRKRPASVSSKASKKRGKKVSSRKAVVQHDSPISKLSHPINAYEMDDESVQEQHFTQGTRKESIGPSPGVPTSIAVKTSKRGGRLPVVPEGIVEGLTVADTTGATDAPMQPEELSPAKSTRSRRNTRQVKKNIESVASVTSNASRSNLRGKRSAVASADHDNASTALETSKKSRTTRSQKIDYVSEVKQVASKARASGRRKKADVDEVSTVASKSTKGKKTDESVSTVGTRRSTRIRAKK